MIILHPGSVANKYEYKLGLCGRSFAIYIYPARTEYTGVYECKTPSHTESMRYIEPGYLPECSKCICDMLKELKQHDIKIGAHL